MWKLFDLVISKEKKSRHMLLQNLHILVKRLEKKRKRRGEKFFIYLTNILSFRRDYKIGREKRRRGKKKRGFTIENFLHSPSYCCAPPENR